MAHSHSHSHARGGRPTRAPRAARLLLAALLAPFLFGTAAGLMVLWPDDATPPIPDVIGPPAELFDGSVTDLERRACAGTEEAQDVDCQAIRVEIGEGSESGRTVELEVSEGPGSPTLREGDAIVLGRVAGDDGTWYFADFQRRTPLLALGLLFAVAVVALARWRGVMALAGLGVSLVVLVRFVLPAILEGKSPVGVAVFGSAAIMFVALYLSHGVNARTTTAVLGTLAALALTGLLAWGFVEAARLTGLASEEAGFLQAAVAQVNLQGLLLGGIVIGSLGVLDDVTVTQASAVWELRAANPRYGARELFSSGLRIGRDHIASTVNTLVLAYAGASLPLLVLFTVANRNLGDVLTGEIVAQEVVRTLVGSVGLIAAVPITTALAAVVAARAE